MAVTQARLRLAFFLIGTALFALVLHQIGLAAIARDLARVGWAFLPIVLLFVPVHLCFAAAWRLTLPPEGRPGFLRGVAVSVTSFALNYVTPLAAVGGEAYRAATTSAWTGGRGATAATLAYYLLHALSNLALWTIAVLLALALFAGTALEVVVMALLAAGLAGAALLVLGRHRAGVFALAHRIVGAVPGLGRLDAAIAAKRPLLDEVDSRIASFYHERPRDFLLALGLDTAGRLLATGEFWLIAHRIGQPVGPLHAIVVGGLAVLSLNVLFFLPLELGSKEAGLYFIARLVNWSPEAGVLAAVASRLRELVWVGVGLVLLALAPAGRREAGAPSVSGPG